MQFGYGLFSLEKTVWKARVGRRMSIPRFLGTNIGIDTDIAKMPNIGKYTVILVSDRFEKTGIASPLLESRLVSSRPWRAVKCDVTG